MTAYSVHFFLTLFVPFYAAIDNAVSPDKLLRVVNVNSYMMSVASEEKQRVAKLQHTWKYMLL